MSQADGIFVLSMATSLMTVRVDLDPRRDASLLLSHLMQPRAAAEVGRLNRRITSGSGFTERRHTHPLHASGLAGYALSRLADGLLFRHRCVTVLVGAGRATQISG
jgi:hypothetical protein